MGQVGGVLFLVAQMSQNSIDNVLVLDAGDGSGRTTATITNFKVDIEYALESLDPGHRDVPFSG